MRKVLFIIGVLLTLGIFCACSNSDDTTDIIEGRLLIIKNPPLHYIINGGWSVTEMNRMKC